MNVTDIFIRRPVLAAVVSLMILVLGLKSMFSLPVLQYPRTQNAVVTVATTYAGADSDIIAGFITTPLENAIAQASGIDYMTSTSQTGLSTIIVNLRLNYDSGKALTEINTKVNSVLNQLPSGAQQPVLTVKVGQTIDSMYIGFSSDAVAGNQITDYLTRVVQPRLQAVNGVQTAELLGAKVLALRVWLNPGKLAAYGLTATQVSTALQGNDYIAGLGTTKGQMVQLNLSATTGLHSLEEFRNLIVAQAGNSNIKLEDVATVSLGSEDNDSSAKFNGNKAVYIGIQVAPDANLLDVIKGVREVYPDIQTQLPAGMTSEIVYDSTQFVNSSISEVISTLFEALAIVTAVVFLFLGSWRSVLIPVVAIPLSLVGTLTVLLALGYSINLLTLLALVLAIGLVVDDAIIVVENVNRHISEGMSPLQAALKAARELVSPIIAMTVVLICVFVPIGFQGGLTGALFTEFVFTLAGAVTVSAVVALTLTPVCCALILKAPNPEHPRWDEKVSGFIDRRMDAIHRFYRRRLESTLRFLPVTAVFTVIVLGSIYWLVQNSTSELAPSEDEGVVLTLTTAAPNATLQQRELYADAAYQTFKSHAETDKVLQIDSPGNGISVWVLKLWEQRKAGATALQRMIQDEMSAIAGTKIVAFQPAPLPGSNGLPIQFVITTTDSPEQLDVVAREFLAQALKTGNFIFLDTDLKIDQPQVSVAIDRQKVSQFGLKMSDVGGALGSMLGGGYTNYFDLDGRSYKVIPQVGQRYRLNPSQLLGYYVRTANGATIPLSTVASLTTKAVPESLNHFQQINSVTISGVAFPGVAAGTALQTLKDVASEVVPKRYNIDYAGESRQLEQESGGIVGTFAFAIVIVFLALAAQFESFRDPLIILVSVPLSIAGAMLFIMAGIGGASINIYTEVGLVTLMGLVSKHGILIVEFANELQHAGKTKREAIVEGASIRLRPILMTTAAMVLGVVPLIVASGAGAASRYNMGLVIAAGLSIGTLFTLFVVPAFYLMLAEDHSGKAVTAGELASPDLEKAIAA
jgi:multidrug efflux pump